MRACTVSEKKEKVSMVVPIVLALNAPDLIVSLDSPVHLPVLVI
jgi:hypothetical protein